jgi:hypothetical protein
MHKNIDKMHIFYFIKVKKLQKYINIVLFITFVSFYEF